MNKAFRSYMWALMLGTLIVQGCTRESVRPDGSSVVAGTAPAATSSTGGAATRAGDEDKVAVRADTRQRFDAVAAAVRKEMSPGGRFEFVSGVDHHTVDQLLADMQALFNQFGAVDKMDADSKIRLFNDQEKINGILTKNDSNRQICTREMPVGTHFPKVVCETYGEIRREQQRNTDFVQRRSMQRKFVAGSMGSTH
ncbi:MAG TPA: hypothetical protein VHA71_06175 [Rhodanobacteraceae bacterium]|nr:hypothetical protein [Rhodanobacteraceae bacterium]